MKEQYPFEREDVADQNDSPELGAMSVEEFAGIIEKEI